MNNKLNPSTVISICNPKPSLQKEQQLEIRELTVADSGHYTVKLYNELGSASATAHLGNADNISIFNADYLIIFNVDIKNNISGMWDRANKSNFPIF